MERTKEMPIELTAKELDAVTGGKATTGPLPPRNPFPWPTGPKLLPTYFFFYLKKIPT